MRDPADCNTMEELRDCIDALDREVVARLARRARYIDRAAEIKAGNGMPARVPARVEEVVSRVRAAAAEHGADTDLMETMWRLMIEWSIAREEHTLGTP